MGLLSTMYGGSILLIIFTTVATVPRCSALSPDGLSLLAFKSAVSADPSSALAGWSDADADPCRWLGVSCANVSGSDSPRVIGVSLSGKNLSGYVPSELGSLVFLRRLNLHGNRLSGSIPAALSNASSLHSLFFYDNNLSGLLPPAICDLPRLQNLDLSKNSLAGPLPREFRNCRQLQRLILARNQFSGEIPPGIWPEIPGLMQLDLSSNQLSGPIPADMGELSSLGGTLNLSHNRFSGGIPASLGKLPATVSLDLRFNNLSGEIPQSGSLANQGPTAFLNNRGLCGFPLENPCDSVSPAAPARQVPAPVSQESAAKKGLRPGVIVLISVADAAGVALIGLILVYVYWKLKDEGKGCSCTGKARLGGGGGGSGRWCSCWRAGSPAAEEEGWEEGGEGELVAIDKGFSFELEELLRASAYVLGKSGLGIVYKVVLGSGVPVAVRRLGGGGGEGAAQRWKEFAAEAQAVGRVRHPNVVRLRAYYWAHDEKLLITDFVANGNLATALRGRSGQPSLSWGLRLKIAKGAARGLAHIHDCSPRKFVHGDVKPSNILLDGDYTAYVSDFGLVRLINIAGADATSSSGYLGAALPPAAAKLDRPSSSAYKAPEACVAGGRPTQKWDVYSFGVVLLELLTGRSPDFSSPTTSSASPPPHGEAELVRWVRKGFEEARPLTEMVDAALLREVHAKKEVLAAFHVALACTEADPEARPRMKSVSDSLEKIGG